MEPENKEIIIAIIASSVLFIIFSGFIISFLFFYNKKKRIHEQQLADQQLIFESEALRSEMEIRENTLRHIAEEIHDNVGQVMLLAKLNLNKYLMANNDNTIEKTRDILGEAIQDLRNMTKSLHADNVTSRDIRTAIEMELQRLSGTGLVETSFIVTGEAIEIDSAKKLILFRMTQEILQNIMKHSKSSKVRIQLHFHKESIILIIHDNGVGFNRGDVIKMDNRDQGSGFRNLQNRAHILGAILNIDSVPDEGTTIEIKCPY